jgi:TRAP-type C4-dicarboxylate transport system substrate-binding protein
MQPEAPGEALCSPANASSGGTKMLNLAKVAGAALLAAALTVGGASAQTVLRSSDTHPDGYPTVEAVKYFGQLIEERTAGRYKVEVYFGAQLGQEADTIEQVRSGVIDLNRVSMAPWNSLVPLTLIPSLPYLFRSPEHARAVMSGPIGDEIAAGFDAHGVVVLAYYDGGARSFYNSKKPINRPEVPRDPIGRVCRHGCGTRCIGDPDALWRGVLCDRNWCHRRRREQLPEL